MKFSMVALPGRMTENDIALGGLETHVSWKRQRVISTDGFGMQSHVFDR
jgi:hypothetical protein